MRSKTEKTIDKYTALQISLSTLTAILGSKTVDAIVSFSIATNETTKSIGGEGTGQTTLGVDIGNVELNRDVVFGGNKTVGGRANRNGVSNAMSIMRNGERER